MRLLYNCFEIEDKVENNLMLSILGRCFKLQVSKVELSKLLFFFFSPNAVILIKVLWEVTLGCVSMQAEVPHHCL